MMNNTMQYAEIIKKIKERRELLKINQAHLAELTGISLRTILAIEKGTRNPSLNTIIKLLDVLGMEIKIEVRKTNY